jgi:glycosyltransferase involved in cell wall biosynthesis
MPPQTRVGPLSERDFFLAMMRSDVAIVPLLPVEGRSVGQQTYLNALALGKPLIVTDTLGVRDHLTADVHALVVPPGDAAAMRAAIDWMQDPAHRAARDAMARAGQQLAAEMTFAHYADRLCRWLREIQAGAATVGSAAASAGSVGDLPAAATLSAYPAPGSPSPDHPPP